MNKFFVEKDNVNQEHITITSQTDIKHLSKVLRLKAGDCVHVSDGEKYEYECTIIDVTIEEVLLKIDSKSEFGSEPKLKVTLFQGIPKGDKMEIIIQKCVEMGIYTIAPVFMERTIVIEKNDFHKKIERWQKISQEAVKQCKRGIIPKIQKQEKFSNIIPKLLEYDAVIFPYENEQNCTIKDCLKKIKSERNRVENVAIIIGPEGGFSPKEVLALEEIKALKVTLGKTILRTETAGIVALAMTMYELEL